MAEYADEAPGCGHFYKGPNPRIQLICRTGQLCDVCYPRTRVVHKVVLTGTTEAAAPACYCPCCRKLSQDFGEADENVRFFCSSCVESGWSHAFRLGLAEGRLERNLLLAKEEDSCLVRAIASVTEEIRLLEQAVLLDRATPDPRREPVAAELTRKSLQNARERLLGFSSQHAVLARWIGLVEDDLRVLL